MHACIQLKLAQCVPNTRGVVVSGGEENSLCAMFLLSTKSWKQLEPLPDERDCHGSIFMKGKIFLFGSWNDGSGSSSVISLELEGGKWHQEPDISISVQRPEVACVDSSIFLFDSWDNNQLLQLDMMTRTWSTKAKAPEQDYRGARMISVNDQLLISDGNNYAFAQYNLSTDTWTTGNAPTLKHNFGALVHHDQKVYLIGGAKEDRVEEYDLDKKTWSVCSMRLPEKSMNLHAFAI